jgi:hypothetical protein
MLELPLAHDDCVTNFFHLGIEFLRSGEDLRNEIHRQLPLQCFVVICGILLDDESSAECVAETYRMRGCPFSGLESVGRC